MQIYINDGVWRQVIDCTVITAVVGSTGSLLAYKTAIYPDKQSAKRAAMR